jgi:outer membrane protein TolC
LPLPQLPDAAAWQMRTATLQQLPLVAMARLEAAAQRAREVEAAAAASSGLVLGGQLQHDPQGNTALVATLGLRWAAFDKGQRNRSQAREATERAAAESEESTLAARQQLALAWHEVEHARQTEALLRDDLLATADLQLQQRELAAKRGVATLFEVIRARRTRLDAERRWVAAQGQRAWAELKAWLLLSALEVR